MWFDDASLMRLEEVDWKIGNIQAELSATIREEEFLEASRFEEVWHSGVDAQWPST